MKTLKLICAALLIMILVGCQVSEEQENVDWAYYQGDPASNQYSSLAEITPENVANLEEAWIYHCGDGDTLDRTQIQCNPLIIDGILYATTPGLKLIALNAATGARIWEFDPNEGEPYRLFGMGVNRGLSYWTDGTDQRIYFSAKSSLFAINAKDGTLYTAFGDGGQVDLHTGLGAQAQEYFVTSNTPGRIFENLLIIGSRVSEAMAAAPGFIRAFDVNTGALAWTFHTIPREGEFGYETWSAENIAEIGGANCWSGMSVDHERGLVFVPTGSAAYDFYGGDRHGENLFANCLIALNARTGERVWHQQLIHHDLWDRDLPAPPNLVQIKRNGRTIDAVAQITKSAYVFIFDRETGEPLFPIEEIPVPSSNLRDEETWPTQPVPTAPPPFTRHRFAEEDITDRTPEAKAYVRAIWQSLLAENQFDPPSEKGTLLLPGFDGGGEWGGAAVSPEGTMYINGSEMPWIIKMVEYEEQTDDLLATKGRIVFSAQCMICHGKDLKGASIYTVPSLVGVKDRLDRAQLGNIIKHGRGLMPSQPNISDRDIEAITAYLFDSNEKLTKAEMENAQERSWKYPYFMSGYIRFKDQEGFPAIKPPWGTLNAIDLNEGKIKWQVTLGNEESVDYPVPTGTQNYGGPIATESGLVFIAATTDDKIRAFASDDGEVLWQADLPAAGYATPSTYSIGGKQYVVIACGGGKIGSPSGDAYVAFALPDK